MTATVVIGMHRSGTSLISQLLHAGGLHLGEEADLVGPAADNEDGFWEHRRIVELNDRLLETVGWSWDRIDGPGAAMSLLWDESVRVEAKEMVDTLSAAADRWGWKDPRTTVTLPFWRELVEDLRVVVAVRDPLEVASSLLARNGIPLHDGLRLWRTYLEHARSATTGLPTLVVHYAELLADAERQVHRLLEFARLDPSEARAVAARAKPRLRHHTNHATEMALQPGPLLDLYEEWSALAGHEPPSVRSEARLEAVVGRVLAQREDAVAAVDARLRQVQQQLTGMARALLAPPESSAYERLRRVVPLLLNDAVPPDADVLVVSKGDDYLLSLPVARARHFPADGAGAFPGHHPASSLTLVAQLEVARTTGATHLFVPAPYRWYLEHYVDLRTHLDARYRVVLDDPDLGVVYAVAAVRPPDAVAQVTQLVRRVARSRPNGEVSVLDWAGLGLARSLEAVSVCSSSDDRRLPYLDDSIDIVAVDAARPQEEALRVAGAAVVKVSGTDVAVEGVGDREAAGPETTIIVPGYGKGEMTETCVRTVLETADGTDIEIVVVDDGSPDDTAARVLRLAEADPRVRLVRNERNLGFIASCNNGAAAATSDSLVFLNNDTVPLPGWLDPLLDLLWSRDDVGAVGGMLLFADGTLQEAGGVIFRDGSGANVGRHVVHVDHPSFGFVREVDYCSGALLATRRKHFEALGGFDHHFAPAYYEDTDYCFRLRDAGFVTLYQPRSVVVHLEGATSGTDVTSGAKRHQIVNHDRFVDRWRHVLCHRPAAPSEYRQDTWDELVDLRPAGRTS